MIPDDVFLLLACLASSAITLLISWAVWRFRVRPHYFRRRGEGTSIFSPRIKAEPPRF